MMDVQATGQIMMDRRGLLAWGGRLAGAGAAGAFLPGMAWAQAAEKYPTIKAEFDSYVSSGKLPGVLATIGRASGLPDVIAVGTQGLGEKTPVNIDTLWRVYSMTKPITGMAAMILVGEGKMKLDQPISEFLPEFANMTVLTDPEKSMDAVPAKKQITVRHLLTHTAGLGYSIIT
jgi:CubicO group peptidase (beta-lactamase class C family)